MIAEFPGLQYQIIDNGFQSSRLSGLHRKSLISRWVSAISMWWCLAM